MVVGVGTALTKMLSMKTSSLLEYPVPVLEVPSKDPEVVETVTTVDC